MQFIPSAFRGPLFMIIATGSYVINDTFMKLATEGLPPYEVLILRGVAALPVEHPAAARAGLRPAAAADRSSARVLLRNMLELVAILSYVVALANMPIADATALGQITPLLLLLGASILFGERIGGLRLALIGLGFVGALMVAQPTMQGISVYALLALANAVLGAARDLAGRRVAAARAGHDRRDLGRASSCWSARSSRICCPRSGWCRRRAICCCSPAPGFFLIFGHFFIFMAYRIGPTGVGGAVLLLLHGLGGDFGRRRLRPVPERAGDRRHPARGVERAGHRGARQAPAPADDHRLSGKVDLVVRF